MMEEQCIWSEDEDHTWYTECKKSFTIMEDMTPAESGFGFCIYCGKKALYVPFKEDSWFPDDEFIPVEN